MWETFTRLGSRIFIEIDDIKHIRRIAKNLEMTEAHCHRILIKFQENGLISLKEVGRIKIVMLTEKGKKVQDHLFQLKSILR
jgi:predicted transcriptional regulator